MNDQHPAQDHSIPELTKVISARRDIVKLCAVEIAISLNEVLGTRIAAEYLHKHKVNIEVALRVLLDPAQRRYGG